MTVGNMEWLRRAFGLPPLPEPPEIPDDEEVLRDITAANEGVRDAMERTLVDWEKDVGKLHAKISVIERPSWDRMYGADRG